MSRFVGWASLAGGVAAGAVSMCAVAQETTQDGLQEIVVTAQKRSENLQDVPISISAFSGDQLRSEGVTSLDQIGAMVPGVDIFQFGQQATTTITVRGVSQNDFADQNEAPVAVYEDGAYNSFIGGAGFNLYDVDRVEILRGPQGTLFGRNATGGLVQIISKQPTDAFEAYATVDGGQYGLARLEGAISGPIGGGVDARLSVSATRQDGFIDNTAGPSLEGTRDVSSRLQFAAHPTDHVDAQLKLHMVRDNVDGTVGYKDSPSVFFPGVNNGLVHAPANFQEYQRFCQGFFGVFPAPGSQDCLGVVGGNPSNPWQVSASTPGVMDRTEWGATGTLVWHISSSTDFTSITDYLHLLRNYLEDTAGSSILLFNYYSNMASWQATQEFRLSGKSDSLTWQTGIYYLDIQHSILDGVDANTGSSPTTDFLTANTVRQGTNSISGFGQADWKFAESMTLTAGLRYIEDRKHMTIDPVCQFGGCATFGFNSPTVVEGGGFNESNAAGLTHMKNDLIAAKLELEKRFSKSVMAYAEANRGTKGGGFNAAAIADIPINSTPYKPETLLDYEAGVKSTFWDAKAQLNAGVFYYDYHNYQAYSLIGLSPYVFNTDAVNRGGEIEARFLPIRGLEISLSGAVENAVAEHVPLQFGVGPYINQRPPQSPRLTWDATVRKVWTLPNSSSIAVQGSVNHVAQRYFNTINDPVLSDKGYTTGNARLTYSLPDGHFEFGIWVNNINNAQYVLTAFDLSTTDGTVNRVYAPPRQVGGTLTYRFN